MTFESVCVVGAGRVGSVVAARLGECLPTRVAGRDLACGDAALVVLCVPDREIAGVAEAIAPGPWLAHVSGATTLAALAPHEKRLGVHPLQTFQHGLGPEQLDGAWGAVSGETDEALAAGVALARLLRLRPFVLDDADRPLYHAAATVASPFLVTLHDAAAELMQAAGAPPEALLPLMRRTLDNGFRPTGPHVRGDWATVENHLAAIRSRRPGLEPLYRELSRATATMLGAPA
jgi:predicted short-subunit dehydrogenase-like oxidoreductase (DUF2520 family)